MVVYLFQSCIVGFVDVSSISTAGAAGFCLTSAGFRTVGSNYATTEREGGTA